ncbi:hypothetical protein, partial [Thiolapillus sp.]|uniref:hypothetical protein n=1 Tax=Thiolapillus sp. TaxID=2017437 RepID=UPI003AF75DA5
MRTTGKQCGLAATGVYQPSLCSPWLAANDFLSSNAGGVQHFEDGTISQPRISFDVRLRQHQFRFFRG